MNVFTEVDREEKIFQKIFRRKMIESKLSVEKIRLDEDIKQTNKTDHKQRLEKS